MALEYLKGLLHVARLRGFGLQIDVVGAVLLNALLAKRPADDVFELGNARKTSDDR